MNLPELSTSVQGGNLKKLPNAMLKDANYYESLNELARIIALKQDDIKDDLVHAMLKSAIKENIINLSTVLTKNINSSDLQLFGTMVENLYDKNSKKLSKGKIKQVLKSLSKDINIYFPVPQHRENVMTHDQDFWVVFHPQIFDKNTEYFVTGFNKTGETRQFSSKHAPIENVLVICYSENQEKYSAERVVCADCDEEQPEGPGPGSGNENPPSTENMELGLRLTKFKTHDIDDGWMDGDLEVKIEIYQSATNVSIEGFNISFGKYVFLSAGFDHDAGTWKCCTGLLPPKLYFNNSHKWTDIGLKRKLAERKIVMLYNNQPIYYNDFTIEIKEEDVTFLSDDELGIMDFNLNTFTGFGSEIEFHGGGGKSYLVIDKGNFSF